MSATGLEVFDRTLHLTNIWLGEIIEEIGPDRQRAYHALRAVLHALRDRLTVEESAHLAAQLPLLVRGIFFDQWRPSIQPQRIRSADEFVAKVHDGLGQVRPIDPQDAIRAVLRTLQHHIDPGEIDEVKRMLPESIRRLWPQQSLAEERAG